MKKFLPFVLIFILILPASGSLFLPGYFSMHDDLQVMRIYELEKCLSDGQIPCRLVPDMGYGYGQPMFNFYSTFPYYLGALIRIVTPLSIIMTVKLLFLIALVGAAFSMYLLAREFWGNLGGILSAVFYTYAPYHALDIFVRGALSEAFALALLPLLWLFLYLLIRKITFPRIAVLALSIAALLTTHNISTLIYIPFTAIWVIFWIVRFGSWRSIIGIGVAGFLGVGLSSFFLLPAILEQQLIQTQFLTTDYLDFRVHFVSIKQLFLDRSWGYGPSEFGVADKISFQIGWPHWWLAIPLVGAGIFWVLRKKRSRALLVFLLLGFVGIAAFLTHARSIFIWEALPILSFVQFPWRFLGLTIFFLSFAGGALTILKFKKSRIAMLAVIFGTIILNVGYFNSQYHFPQLTDQEKLSGVSFEIQQKSAILDYLPKTAKKAPEAPAPQNPQILSGAGIISNFSKRSNSFGFDAEIFKEGEVEIPVMYFPNWRIISGTSILQSKITSPYGLISLNLAPGKYIIRGTFEDTPIRTIANTMTIFSLVLLFGVTLLWENRKKVL